MKGKSVAEYIFIDGTGLNTRGKTKVMNKEVKSLNDFSTWVYDGSSTA